MAKKQSRTSRTRKETKAVETPEAAPVRNRVPMMDREICPKCGSIRRRVMVTRPGVAYLRCKHCLTNYKICRS